MTRNPDLVVGRGFVSHGGATAPRAGGDARGGRRRHGGQRGRGRLEATLEVASGGAGGQRGRRVGDRRRRAHLAGSRAAREASGVTGRRESGAAARESGPRSRVRILCKKIG